MGKKTKKAAPAQESPPESGGQGVLGYMIGGAIGLVLLAALYALTRKPETGEILEYPHLSILVEFADLADPQTRADLVGLQRELEDGLGLEVRGPASYPLLVPGEALGETPSLRTIDGVSPEELALARPYFQVASWLVPRVYSEDLTSAVIRAWPKQGGRFLPGTARAVRDVLDRHRGGSLSGLWPYSFDLGLTDAEAQARTNVLFGVQFANVPVYPRDEGALRDMETLIALDRAARKIPSPLVRSVATQASWYLYAEGIRTGQRDPLGPATVHAELAAIYTGLAEEAGVQRLISDDGLRALVKVYTQAEGQANLDLCWSVATALHSVDKAVPRVERRRW